MRGGQGLPGMLAVPAPLRGCGAVTLQLVPAPLVRPRIYLPKDAKDGR